MTDDRRQGTEADDEWLTAAEVGRRLGLGARTVRAMLADGRLRGAWLGARTLRISSRDLAAYLDAARAKCVRRAGAS